MSIDAPFENSACLRARLGLIFGWQRLVEWPFAEGVGYGFGVEVREVSGDEFAEVFRAEVLIGEVAAFFFQVLGRDARATRGGGFDSHPVRFGAHPLFVEKALTAVGRGH